MEAYYNMLPSFSRRTGRSSWQLCHRMGWHYMLYDAAEPLKVDKEIVTAAVSQNGNALQYAAEPLKADRDIVMAAVSLDGKALKYAAEPLKADKDIILAALFAPSITRRGTHIFDDELEDYVEIIYTFISKDLCGDKEITLRLIDLYGDDLPLAFLYSFVQKYSDRLLLYSIQHWYEHLNIEKRKRFSNVIKIYKIHSKV